MAELKAGWSRSDIPKMAHDVLNDLNQRCSLVQSSKLNRYSMRPTENSYEGRYFFGSGELPASTYRVSRAATAYVKAVKAGLIRLEDLSQYADTLSGAIAKWVAYRTTTTSDFSLAVTAAAVDADSTDLTSSLRVCLRS
jgi:hypothetical protein